jgi:hypothetical protein
MASTLSQLQSIPITQDWADLELAQELAQAWYTAHVLKESSFGWRNVLNSRKTLGEELLLLYMMMMMNLSSSVMLCELKSGCEERVVKAPVTAE